jgi:parallel beta-helix repeat protein
MSQHYWSGLAPSHRGQKVSIESFKGVLLAILLVTSLIALPSFITTITPQTASANPSQENFTIVVLPDTQFYSESYPWIFENQTEWIVQNENSQNIVFVAHIGDVVNTASSIPQWENADNAMRILDSRVPYGILPGNHDLQDGGTNYSLYFPASRYENYSYWGGSYSNNKNNYQLFSAGGMNFIALSLQYNPPADVISWADNVLENHADRRAIISTHSYLNLDGSLTDTGGTNIYNNVVVPNNNVFLVLCGHNHGEVMRSSSFDNNRIVYQILADYQDYDNGGNGYLRIIKFAPAENKIYVKTYSSYQNQYETDSNSQFELTYPISASVSSGWLYRRQITISPLNPENFQIKVVIPADVPKSDYPSIRFFENENSGALPYWIENCDNGSDTTVYENVVWVRRLENDDNTIWMYYHNPSASSAANGDNVFMFFDDFGGGNGGQSALNTNKWGSTAHGVDVYQTALRLEDYSNETDYIEHTPSKGMNTTEENTRRIVEFRIKNSSTWRGGIILTGPGWGDKEMWGLYYNSGNKFFGKNNSGGDVWGTVNLESDKWYIGRITFYGDTKSNIARSILYGADNANYRQQADNIADWTGGTWNPGGPNYYFDTYRPRAWDGGGTSSYYFDWFIVRKWAAIEPVATVGAAQYLGVSTSISPASQSGANGATLTYTVTISNNGTTDDNYTLSVTDNAGWNPSVLPTSLMVPAFGSDNTTTLRVTIPSGTAVGTIDSITVTATSQTDNTVSDSDSCSARDGLIYINGNSDFTKPGAVNGGGSGTENDPYIIENYVINASENHGIWINNTTAFFILRNCLVENGEGSYYGIYLYNIINGKVDNCTSDNNRYGTYIYSSDNSVFTNNLYSNNSRYGMGLYSSDNNKFRNNSFLNNAYNLDLGGTSLSDYYQDMDNSNTINGKPIYYMIEKENLTFDGSTLDIGFLGLVSCENILVKNLDITNNGQGILFVNTSRSMVVSSTFDNNYSGIYLRASDNNTIENNTCDNGPRDGLYLWFSDINTLRGNTFDNNDYAGISLYSSSNNTFENNTCDNNKWYGIYFFTSNNNNFENNSCDNNNNAGIYLYSSSNTLTNNTFVNNKQYGIYLYSYDNNNIITGNTCENNPYGIYLGSSYNNIIYHNNFVNETHQATDLGTNTWDNGYPSGGNYWSDYIGVDNYSGENQNIPGGDGIGDDSYYIPGGSNMDNYPLMSPWQSVIRGVIVSISPSDNSGPNGATLTYTVTVTNTGNVSDNYSLLATDNAGWSPSVLPTSVVVPAFSRDNTTTLSVAVPAGAIIGTIYNMTVTVTSQTENTLSASDRCTAQVVPIWMGTATFKLESLYKVSLEKDLQINTGSKLIVKFYDYSDTYESEVVIENFAPPQSVVGNENVPHPAQGSLPVRTAVKKAVLVLTTDNTANEISTIASFTVHQSDLRSRYLAILRVWAGYPGLQSAFRAEIIDILKQWAGAPG